MRVRAGGSEAVAVPDRAQDRRHRHGRDDRHAVNEMIRRRAEQAGFTAAQTALLSGHSPRSGFVTEAFGQGADVHSTMRQTGHRSPVMLEVYAREHAP